MEHWFVEQRMHDWPTYLSENYNGENRPTDVSKAGNRHQQNNQQQDTNSSIYLKKKKKLFNSFLT